MGITVKPCGSIQTQRVVNSRDLHVGDTVLTVGGPALVVMRSVTNKCIRVYLMYEAKVTDLAWNVPHTLIHCELTYKAAE